MGSEEQKRDCIVSYNIYIYPNLGQYNIYLPSKGRLQNVNNIWLIIAMYWLMGTHTPSPPTTPARWSAVRCPMEALHFVSSGVSMGSWPPLPPPLINAANLTSHLKDVYVHYNLELWIQSGHLGIVRPSQTSYKIHKLSAVVIHNCTIACRNTNLPSYIAYK